ncbi:rho GTPase-activating protein 12-like isoform X3 [Acipenser ruthenus]|uniref:rho GTPase-activating protein 12-like isoform X3 n=1 Tax=Acipenser ruthenus TaxID=7906 RepID=UPI00145A3813|nr:rho GTPase-activating protein 12-like isoform X3 [Acipenser ruthenus]
MQTQKHKDQSLTIRENRPRKVQNRFFTSREWMFTRRNNMSLQPPNLQVDICANHLLRSTVASLGEMEKAGQSTKEYVLVEYEFEYTARDGSFITIKPNERYILLSRTNDNWWHVRKDENTKAFYIPAKYVKELPSKIPSVLDFHPANVDSDIKKDPSFSLMSDKPTDARVQLPSNLNYKKNEYRLSTFGVPMEIHDSVYKRTASESLIALKPIPAEINTSPCPKDTAPQAANQKHLKRYSLEPGFLLGPRGTVDELPSHNLKVKAEYTVGLNTAPCLSPANPVRPQSMGDILSGTRESVSNMHKENQPPSVISRPGRQRASSERTYDETENVYESIPDIMIPKDTPAEKGTATTTPKLVSENPDTAVYVNVPALKQEASWVSPTPHPTKRHLSSETQDWEVHTDQGSGQEFYYNPATGETTWDSPFSDQEEATEDQDQPPPSPTVSPHCSTEWEQHLDETSGQYYFYNPQSGETSWEPPEQEEPSSLHHMEAENQPQSRPPLPEEDYPTFSEEQDGEVSPNLLVEDYSTVKRDRIPRVKLDTDTPEGWSCEIDKDGQMCYTSNCTQEQWIKSKDDHGQTYFYKTDGSKSQWTLPQSPRLNQPRIGNGCGSDANMLMKNWRHTMVPPVSRMGSWDQEDTKFLPTHRRNMSSDFGTEDSSYGNSLETPQPADRISHRRNASDFSAEFELGNPVDFLQPHLNLEKAGILNKTKIVENGKRLRKNWSQSWTVLHGGILTFYKDPKSQQTGTLKQSNQIVPEYTVELRGATIGWASKDKSSKKNVCELKTRNGSEYLVQYDKETIISDWHKVIMETIRKLGPDHPSEDEESVNESFGSEKSPSATDKDEKDKKNRSTRQNLSSTQTDTDPKKVRTKLRKFLQRRPTLQSVREKGYIRDQVFGCHLDTLCERENTTVPVFVEKCIQTVEQRGLDIDGIYRVSGNLAVIQKLRFKVDHEENLDLDDGLWEDIHVITGSLKLFFRELPEPLFPFTHFDNFIAAIKIADHNQKINYMRDLVRSLPRPNHDTMSLLFQHLRKVVEYRDENRMSVQSVAIVFGPTLLKPESETGNIAMHMVFQNQIVECILNDYEHIFQDS